MKQINLLPKSSWWEQYQRLFAFVFILLLAVSLGLYLSWPHIRLSISPTAPAALFKSFPTQHTQHSVYKLKMVGYLSNSDTPNSQTLSILELPDGEISTVKIDDHIGAEAAKVVEIQPTTTVVSLPETKQLVNIKTVSRD